MRLGVVLRDDDDILLRPELVQIERVLCEALGSALSRTFAAAHELNEQCEQRARRWPASDWFCPRADNPPPSLSLPLVPVVFFGNQN